MIGHSDSTTSRLNGLSEEKRELLRLLRESRSRQARAIKPCPRVEGTTGIDLPAAGAQQRMWFIDQLEGGTAGYTVLVSLRLRGALNEAALQEALTTVVQRHEVLRTVFVNVNGEVTQHVLPKGNFALGVIDLTRLGETQRDAQVKRHKLEEAHGKFDLTTGPLIRGRLLRVESEEYLLLLTMHHIVADGWSKGVLVRELTEIYRAHLQGRPHALEPLPIQYGDYAHWQRQWAQSDIVAKGLAYWRAQLEGAPPELELPTDRPRPAVQSFRGKNVAVGLDARLTSKLKGLAQRQKVTLFMLLYGAWSILLSRLAGQEEIVVGTPIANRQRPEVENLIGLFVNTLALRTPVRSRLRVGEFLEQVKQVTLAAFDHQEVPFEQVVESLHLQRTLSRSPLFQVMFVLHNWPKMELRWPDLSISIEDGTDEPSILDLWLSLEERGEEIVGSVNYATDLFDRGTIQTWVTSFAVVLQAMVDRPQSRIGDLPILTRDGRDQVVERFNATRAAYPREKLIQQVFEEHALRTPNAPAVVYEEKTLTYSELNELADRLAERLCALGSRPGACVPLVMPRCLDMVIAQLAVLKSGGIFVPIDPQLPAERQTFMIRDCGARFVLCDTPVRQSMKHSAVDWVDYATALREGEGQPASMPRIDGKAACSQSAALLMYTSGSTGVPKGVLVTHRGVTRLVINNGYAQIDATDCVVHCSNPAFDASTFEVWGALLNGARVLIVPHPIALETQQLADVLRRHGATVLFQTTALFNQRAMESPEIFSGLRYLFFGGEASDANAVRRLLRYAPPQHLLHVYGPTETATYATWYAVKSVDNDARTIPIGRPISNTQIYILDRRLQPVPTGVTGEIYIGGDGLALGYLNRPELTAERFVPDPFGPEPDARLYRSGDLGRWRADGNIDFLGRNDQQVKLRGFRIELGEIEAQLARHPRIREAAVVVREDIIEETATDIAAERRDIQIGDREIAPVERRLVAYITLRSSERPGSEELRSHLRTTLPDYMVPSAFVVLERLPLTANGKLDRRALPLPDGGNEPSGLDEPPVGESEQVLASIWQELLRVKRVGRHANFFELGGHSLMATRLVSRVRERMGVELPLRAVFDRPTLQALATDIAAGGNERSSEEALRLAHLAQSLREEIGSMSDADVLARIAELERDGGLRETFTGRSAK